MNSSLTARLGDLVEILSGFAFDSTKFSDEGDVALIRIRDVLRGQSSTFYRGEYDPKYLINAGEILIGMDGEFNRARWRSAPALLNQRVCRISSSSPRLSEEYLFHFLPAALKSIEDVTSFVTVKHLSAKQIREIEVPLPPIEAQRRIATILDQAETLRAQRRAALTQLDSLTRSIFLDMFGDALTSANRVAMGELVSEFRYGTSEKSGASGFPALRIPNVASGSLDLNELKTVAVDAAEFDRLRLLSGDILFVRTNGNPDYVGRCAVFEPALVASTAFAQTEFIYASYLIRARLKGGNLLPLVLQHYLSEGEGRRALRARCKTSAGQYNINTEGLGAIPVPVFPLPLQQTFTTRIQAIEALKATHRAALAELDALFASLQQRAFSGELTQSTSPVQVAHTKARDFSELCKLDADKGLEALIYVARRMPEHHFYKSLKALYFADKHQLEHQGRLIYGETHCALPMGPVPQAAYDAAKVLSGELLVSAFDDEALRASLRRTEKELIPLRDADPAKLSAEERASLDWAIRYLAPMSFDQVKTASHDSAYERTPRNQPIQLEHIVEMLPEAAKRRFFD